MGEFDIVDQVPRRVMVLFFVVDTSGSMKGDKLESVNTTVREIIPDIRDIAAGNTDAQIKVAALDFSSGVDWMYPQPKLVEEFEWIDLEAGGLTSFGEACVELSNKLTIGEGGFMSEAKGSFAPCIILLSDGQPTDNYKHGLEKLKGKKWFQKAIKIAIAIGNDVTDKGMLEEFTGNAEAVLQVHTKDQLKKIIRFVSVTPSEVASKSSSVGVDAPETKQEEVLGKVKEEVLNNPDFEGVEIGTDPPKYEDQWNNSGW